MNNKIVIKTTDGEVKEFDGEYNLGLLDEFIIVNDESKGTDSNEMVSYMIANHSVKEVTYHQNKGEENDG